MWLNEHLPAPLRTAGPGGLVVWQWLALPIVFVLAWVIGIVLGRLTRAFLTMVAGRTRFSWDDQLVEGLRGPLTLAWTVAASRLLLPLLALPGTAQDLAYKGLRTAVFLAFFWFLLRLVVVFGKVLSTSTWAQARPATRSLLPLGARIVQVGVLAMAVVAVLADLGYPVASLVAGLGIGGLALALAGQKTVENLFGAFSIGVDQPFRVGDFINVEGVMGTVEDVGLRSTRIRTPDRTLVTIPNGKLADMRIETFAPRDKIRLGFTLRLDEQTTADQMRAVLEGCDRALRASPKAWQDDVVCAFKEITPSALELEIQVYFLTTDYGEYRRLRQDTLLGLLQAVEAARTRLAHPLQTVELTRRRAAPVGG